MSNHIGAMHIFIAIRHKLKSRVIFRTLLTNTLVLVGNLCHTLYIDHSAKKIDFFEGKLIFSTMAILSCYCGYYNFQSDPNSVDIMS